MEGWGKLWQTTQKGTERSTKPDFMAQRLVAEMMIETLVAAGVKRIYGVVGDSLNGLLEEIRRCEDIEWIGVRHEETAAFGAGAQAHVTGELAVCAGSCGPIKNGLWINE